jgi:hypothetical protein
MVLTLFVSTLGNNPSASPWGQQIKLKPNVYTSDFKNSYCPTRIYLLKKSNA